MNFLDQLKDKKILSQQDIHNFRNYINKKYRTLGDDRKHTILKNSITYVINRDLAELKIDHEEDLVCYLVEKILLEDKKDLCADLIFKKLLSEGEPSDSLLQNLTKWVNHKTDIPLKKEMLEEHCSGNNLYHKNCTLEANFPLPYFTFLPKKICSHLLWITMIIFSFYSVFFMQTTYRSFEEVTVMEKENIEIRAVIPAYVLQRYNMPNRNFPNYLYYRDIDEENLKSYLSSRDSLLNREPYFSQILATAKDFDLNPLLLFAIAGHEQGFVPEDHPNSEIMINNPFNVFGSWQKYNTNLKETSEITARTIFNSLSDLPPLIDPFFWMNRRYAEDSSWWHGVRSIFWNLEKDC